VPVFLADQQSLVSRGCCLCWKCLYMSRVPSLLWWYWRIGLI